MMGKMTYVEPLKTKKSAHVAEAFRQMFTKMGETPMKLQTDKGTEFLAETQQVFKEFNVYHFTTLNYRKAAQAENSVRLVKDRIHKFLTANNTKSYIDALPEIVDGLNNTTRRTTGFKPSEVTLENQHIVRERLFPKIGLVKYRFAEGDRVRIATERTKVSKGLTPRGRWSEEIFTIMRRVRRSVPMYKLRSSVDGLRIQGTFNEPQLSLAF